MKGISAEIQRNFKLLSKKNRLALAVNNSLKRLLKAEIDSKCAEVEKKMPVQNAEDQNAEIQILKADIEALLATLARKAAARSQQKQWQRTENISGQLKL